MVTRRVSEAAVDLWRISSAAVTKVYRIIERSAVAVGHSNGNPTRQRGSSGVMADFISRSYQGVSDY